MIALTVSVTPCMDRERFPQNESVVIKRIATSQNLHFQLPLSKQRFDKVRLSVGNVEEYSIIFQDATDLQC